MKAMVHPGKGTDTPPSGSLVCVYFAQFSSPAASYFIFQISVGIFTRYNHERV